MANFFDDHADLQFYMSEGIDWEPVVRVTEYEFKAEDGHETVSEAVEFYRDVLSMIGGFVCDEIAPHTSALDKMKPKLVDGEISYDPWWDELFEQIKELELHRLCIPRELGGMNAPMMVLHMMNELFARADVSVCSHNGFHGGMALAALSYSILEGSTEFQADPPAITKTRFAEVIEEISSGEAWGSMDITESDAGSDMGELRVKGEVDDEGNWFVTGQKIFITSGHAKWHYVIARTEEKKGDGAMDGLKGLSMFLVPAFVKGDDGEILRTVTSLDNVEDKLGHTASATVSISYDRAPARLIGERGQGFKLMLVLMNSARVGVGFECLGLIEAARSMATEYAADRRSMGKTIDKHEMIAEYLELMQTDAQGIRAMAMAAAWHEEIAQKTDFMLRVNAPTDADELKAMKRRHKRHQRRSRHLTPLLKYYGAEQAVLHTRRAVQILGGSGYMKDYGAEKLLRDAMVMPIYEGTSQIQALMAMKDNLIGVIKDPARFVRSGADIRWRMVSARSPLERRIANLQHLQHATLRHLITKLTTAKMGDLRGRSPGEWKAVLTDWDPKRDFAMAMLHAERLCRILVDVAVAEELHEQVRKAPQRREVLERWLEQAEPRCRYEYDVITTTGSRLLKRLASEEEE